MSKHNMIERQGGPMTAPTERRVPVAVIEAPADHVGAEYVVIFPDGRVVRLGEAQAAYWALADAIDYTYETGETL